MENRLCLYWLPEKDGARLVRVWGENGALSLPDTVDGRPITAIGEKCFAPVQPVPLSRCRRTGEEDASLLPVCGENLSTLSLGDAVRDLHYAAFSGCRHLTRLSLGPAVSGVGSQVFTQCSSLERVEMRALPQQPTGLRRVLGGISSDITVAFSDGTRLFFPEVFESIDENAPAHLFSLHFEGRGYPYRQCFRQEVFNFSEYDAQFPLACGEEPVPALVRIAQLRLQSPHPPAPAEEARYRAVLLAHAREAGALWVQQRDEAALRFLCRTGLLTGDDLSFVCRQASRAGWGEGSALLLQHAASSAIAKSKRKSYDF